MASSKPGSPVQKKLKDYSNYSDNSRRKERKTTMPSFENKSEGLSFMKFYEPLFINLLNQYYFSRYGISIKKNPDRFDVDAVFTHPETKEEYGVELKTTKTYFRNNISNFAVYENNQSESGTNEIHKYMNDKKIYLAYLDWQRRRILIIHNQQKLSALFTFNSNIGLADESIRYYNGKGWRMRQIPIDKNTEWFDDIIYLDKNDDSCQMIEDYCIRN